MSKEFTTMMKLKLILVLGLLWGSTAAVAASAGENPVEVGDVHWGRDLDWAYGQSAKTGKPVLVLFQEIPGCAGCQRFGNEVLKQPLLVEAMEDEFHPVLVYNNRDYGDDRKWLEHFQEPAWNYQVIRFLNAAGDDVIPRKDRVWTIGGVAARMIQALKSAKRPVPKYLETVAEEHDNTETHETATFAMSCFWTGEFELGQIDGVVSTEAGWLEGREVTRVTFRKDQIPFQKLSEKAAAAKCADKVYEKPGKNYRKAKDSDQKKQVQRWRALREVKGITDMQWTKINALAPIDKDKALEWLSPRQKTAFLEASETTTTEYNKFTSHSEML